MQSSLLIESLTPKERAELQTLIYNHGSGVSKQVLDTLLDSSKRGIKKEIGYHRQYQFNEKALTIASALSITRTNQYHIDQELANSVKHLTTSLFLEAKRIYEDVPGQYAKASEYAASGGHQLLQLFLQHREWLNGKYEVDKQRIQLCSALEASLFCIKSQIKIADWVDALYSSDVCVVESRNEIELAEPKTELYSTLLTLCSNKSGISQGSVQELVDRCRVLIESDVTYAKVEKTLLSLWLAVITAKKGRVDAALESLIITEDLCLDNRLIVTALSKLTMTVLMSKRDDLLLAVLRKIEEANGNTAEEKPCIYCEYLHAFRLFLEREYREARHILQGLRFKDMATMSTAAKILIAICFHQEQICDLFEFSVESLFKSISRMKVKNAQTEIVIRFLRQYVKHNYDGKVVNRAYPDFFGSMIEPRAESTELLIAIIPIQYLIITRCAVLQP